MSAPVGFDEGALLEHPDGTHELVEVALEGGLDDGCWRITIERDNGQVEHLTLRAAFLDELVAQARAREADAA
jgi:hypothetical protein